MTPAEREARQHRQQARVNRLAARLTRRVFAFHEAEEGADGTYDAMMESAQDLATALAGRVPPRRWRRPARVESVIEASRRIAREQRERDGG